MRNCAWVVRNCAWVVRNCCSTPGWTTHLQVEHQARIFGTLHLGSIRGVMMTMTVVGTAVALFLVSVGHDLNGSHLPVLRLLLVLPIEVVLVGLIAHRTTPHGPLSSHRNARPPGGCDGWLSDTGASAHTSWGGGGAGQVRRSAWWWR